MPNTFEPENGFPAIVPGLSVVYREDAPGLTLGGQVRVVQGRAEFDRHLVKVGLKQDSPPLNNIEVERFWRFFRPMTLDDAFNVPEVRTTPDDGEPATAADAASMLRATREKAESEGADAIADSLRSWWLDVASQEVEPLISKMFEYGGVGRSNDLVEIGRKMVALGVPYHERFLTGHGNMQEGMLAEYGIFFYVEGKMARWSAAIAEGRPVSDDTLLDIGIYVRMVQRIRAVGGWPV